MELGYSDLWSLGSALSDPLFHVENHPKHSSILECLREATRSEKRVFGLMLVKQGAWEFLPKLADALPECITGQAVKEAMQSDWNGARTDYSRWMPNVRNFISKCRHRIRWQSCSTLLAKELSIMRDFGQWKHTALFYMPMVPQAHRPKVREMLRIHRKHLEFTPELSEHDRLFLLTY
jgi:hypothetical protein